MSRRIRTFSSGETVGVGALIVSPRSPMANSEGSRAKRPWMTTGSGRASGSVASRARSSIRGDQVDVDGLGVERPPAGLLDAVGPHFFTSPNSR